MDYTSRTNIGLREPLWRSALPTSDGVFVHYLGEGRFGPRSAPGLLMAVQDFHMDHHGWSDIAYSWAVDQRGYIWECRGWGVTGGHTLGYNASSHGILWLGGTGDEPTAEALEAIVAVCDEHDRRFGVGYRRPHGFDGSTACPGPHLTEWIADGMPTQAPAPPPPTDWFDMATEAELRKIVREEVRAEVGGVNARLTEIMAWVRWHLAAKNTPGLASLNIDDPAEVSGRWNLRGKIEGIARYTRPDGK